MKIASDWLSVLSLVVSIILTISIFYLSNQYSSQTEINKKKQYTVIWANDLFYRIDKAVAEKILLEKTNELGLVPLQNLSYISSNKEIESLVNIILNQYSALGRAAAEDLVNIDQIRSLRSDAIINTWEFYKLYITEYRKDHKDAWQDFEIIYNEMANK